MVQFPGQTFLHVASLSFTFNYRLLRSCQPRGVVIRLLQLLCPCGQFTLKYRASPRAGMIRVMCGVPRQFAGLDIMSRIRQGSPAVIPRGPKSLLSQFRANYRTLQRLHSWSWAPLDVDTVRRSDSRQTPTMPRYCACRKTQERSRNNLGAESHALTDKNRVKTTPNPGP
jgi:hypothetical protein